MSNSLPFNFRYTIFERKGIPFTQTVFASRTKEKIFGLFNTSEALNRKFNYALLHSSAGADLGGGCRGCAPPPPF